MNYRQWKKNYKKKHGCNPPLELDKRKQAKVAKKVFNKIKDIKIPELAKGIVNAFSNAFIIIGEAFTNAGESLKTE